MDNSGLLKIDFTMVIQIINFLILAYAFWKNFGNKIGKILDDRKEIALSEMIEVEAQRQAIENKRDEIEKLKKESKRRANNIIIKAEGQADERREKILSDATMKRDRMIIKAGADIEKMRQNARFELQKEVTDIATTLAEKIIKENVKGQETKTIDKFIDDIGE